MKSEEDDAVFSLLLSVFDDRLLRLILPFSKNKFY